MKNVNNKERDLLVIGNGFDLALGLHSSFKDYINIKNYACMLINLYFNSIHNKDPFQYNDINKDRKLIINRLSKQYPTYFNIVKFINMLRDDQNKLCHKISKINRIFPLKKLSRPMINHPSKRYTISPWSLSRDYFNILLWCSKSSYVYLLRPDSFNIGPDKDKKLLMHQLNNINQWTQIEVRKLKIQVDYIKNGFVGKHFNFWKLLMLVSKYLDITMFTYKTQNINEKDISKNWYNKSYFNDWYDVENIIKEFIISVYNLPKYGDLWQYLHDENKFSRRSFELFTYVNRYLDFFSVLIKKGMPINNLQKNNHYSIYSLYKHVLRNISSDISMKESFYDNRREMESYINISNSLIFIWLALGYNPTLNLNKDHDYLFTLLRRDVKDFEQDFGTYLTNQLDSMYIDKSSKFLNRLAISRDLRSLTKNYSVLDFNYTPLNKNIRHIKHVHGTLEHKDEVIGVGEQEIDRLRQNINHPDSPHYITNSFYEELYSFTKTYRLFAFKHRYDPSFLRNINNIVFYGHSLGANDYPYFEALFDHFHLYSNPHINLIFCYSGHSEKSNHKVRQDLIPRIVNLLRNYSDSISKPHSENFIARMFVEDRIKLYDLTYN